MERRPLSQVWIEGNWREGSSMNYYFAAGVSLSVGILEGSLPTIVVTGLIALAFVFAKFEKDRNS